MKLLIRIGDENSKMLDPRGAIVCIFEITSLFRFVRGMHSKSSKKEWKKRYSFYTFVVLDTQKKILEKHRCIFIIVKIRSRIDRISKFVPKILDEIQEICLIILYRCARQNHAQSTILFIKFSNFCVKYLLMFQVFNVIVKRHQKKGMDLYYCMKENDAPTLSASLTFWTIQNFIENTEKNTIFLYFQ
jgi:hypothetical protein